MGDRGGDTEHWGGCVECLNFKAQSLVYEPEDNSVIVHDDPFF